MRIILAAPRGFCAGVNMAIESLEQALRLYGTPLYVYHEIVHNRWVVERFRDLGVVFVDDLAEVPEGSHLLYSAHGVSPEVRRQAAQRRLQTIDATCPLVTKVHREAVRYAAEGYTIVLIGHAGHDEVIGTMGEAPEAIVSGPERRRRRPAGAARPAKTCLSDPDDAFRRRGGGDHCPAPRSVSRTSSGRRRTTSAMPRKIGRRRCGRWPPQADVVLVVGSEQ